jgi:hypothetical protein
MKRFSHKIIRSNNIIQKKSENLYKIPNLDQLKSLDNISMCSSDEKASNTIFVTGCNSPYFEPWLRLYESIKKNVVNPTVYFFDLGINDKEKNIINQIDVIYKFFNFDLYPDWVNVNNQAGQWAWKAQCIKEVMDSYTKNNDPKYLIWCDARNMVNNKLDGLINFLDINGIYTNKSGGNIIDWTVNETIEYFEKIEGLNVKKYLKCPMINAALPCFNIKIDWVREFINEFSRLSLIKDCIFPRGSSYANHRQDQSILTILYYKYKDIYHFKDGKEYEGINHHTIFIKKPY